MKICLYARVSKEEEGLQDPYNQIDPMKKFCEAMNWEVKGCFIDRCSGGNSNRPNFQAMLGHVRQRHYDLILVWALDRFSREGIHQTLGYINQLKKYKTHLKSLQESWLDTTQEGVSELLLSIFSWVASEERRKISERTKSALARLKRKGVKLGRPKKKRTP